MRGNTGYAPKKARTQAMMVEDARRFIRDARDHAVLATTPDQLNDFWGVQGRDDRRAIEAALLAKQDAIRRAAL